MFCKKFSIPQKCDNFYMIKLILAPIFWTFGFFNCIYISVEYNTQILCIYINIYTHIHINQKQLVTTDNISEKS